MPPYSAAYRLLLSTAIFQPMYEPDERKFVLFSGRMKKIKVFEVFLRFDSL